MRAFPVALTLLLWSAPALAAGGFGHVSFANSGAPAAQADFQEAMAMLHDFEYESAAKTFRRVQAADPGFAMAYWGEAMTYNHPIWMEQDLESARAALNRLAPTPAARRAKAGTGREKDYLDAIEILYGDGTKIDRDFRYEAAMKKLHEEYPGDVDATAFYGLSILGTAHAGRDIPTYMRAAGVLEEAWVDHREHPGLVHYLIHSYDDPAHAPLGLRAARIYARIAPDAGHAQHMTSHIFLALGMWKESLEANIHAIAAVDRMREAAGRDPLVCGHYPTWLGYSYLQLGRTEAAHATLERCGDQAVAAAGARAGESLDPDHSLGGSFANMRLRYLIDTGDWKGDVARATLPPGSGAGARLDFAFGNALCAVGVGDPAAAGAALKDLETVGSEVAAIERNNADPDSTYRIRPAIFVMETKGLIAELNGDVAGAGEQLAAAAAAEDRLPIAFGPPTIDKPTHELLGEFLLRHGKAAEARAEFVKALARTPGRRLAVQGLAASAGAAPR